MVGEGIPFVGENGFYPRWIKGSPRWVFQRTLVSIGRMSLAELVAQNTPVSNEVIVWAPGSRGIASWFAGRTLHREREVALGQLASFCLKCYRDDCNLAPQSEATAKAVVRETGLHPEEWRLACPYCGGVVGPDICSIRPEPIIAKWEILGRPELENPGASPDLSSALAIRDLPGWIGKCDPSPLELAYIAQQMWADIGGMLDHC